MSSEKLRVVCFLCKWASTEENQAISRRKTADVNVVKVPCIGGLDPVVVVETFTKGVDGILLVGCGAPDCHFVEGSVYAEFTAKVLNRLLALTGLEPERLGLRLVSPIEEIKFADIMENFVTQVEKLGSSPLGEAKHDANIFENVLAAKNAVADFRLRAFIGKEMELARNANVYGERLSREEFSAMVDEVVSAEFIRQKIFLLAKKKPFSVKELAQTLNMKPAVVFRHVLNMRRRGIIALDSTEGTTPLYKALEVQ